VQIELNFAEALWRNLKAWAKERADGGAPPTVEECASQVERLSSELIGPGHTLREEVIEFYAGETADMIERYRIGL
jgi:hypothetical protein